MGSWEGEDHGVGGNHCHGKEDVWDIRAGAHDEGISGRVHNIVLPSQKGDDDWPTKDGGGGGGMCVGARPCRC